MTELVREYDAGVKDGIAAVFLHDVGGDRRHAWMRNPANAATFWPRWLGVQAGCDTWTAGYDADLRTWSDTASALYVHGLAVMDRLATEPGLSERPLLLVGHGVGGLLIKKIIVHALTKGGPRHRRMVDRIHGLAFVAVPQIAAELDLIARAICMRQGSPLLGKDFAGEDASLCALNGEFSALCAALPLQVREFAESKTLPTGRKWLGLWKVRNIVVPPAAVNPHVPGSTATVLPEDHFSISKPHGPDAPLHRAIAALIDACRATQPAAVIAQAEASAMPAPRGPTAGIEIADLRPALVENANDFRLQPCEKKLYGRDRELTRILTFLDDDAERAAVVVSRTEQVGGVGKTELCKAALRIWVGRGAGRAVFYLDLPEHAGPDEFTRILAHGIGIVGTASFDQFKALLPPGMYYLDNVGDLIRPDAGRRLLSAMRDLPGVRIFASSRRPLAADFGAGIEVDALPKPAALALFRDLWGGSDILPVDTVLAQFVDGDLQRHALSICLVARLGDFFGYEEIIRRWHGHRNAAPEESRASLLVSLRLTGEALSTKRGAMPMWAFAAGFPDGVDGEALGKLEAAEGDSPKTREFLQHHRILEQRGGRFHVLAPLARFARNFPALSEAQ